MSSKTRIKAVILRKKKRALLRGDSLKLLKKIPKNSIDSIVCDPPAGISFMAAKWDDNKGGRDSWVAWLTEIMNKCLRAIKPGGHILVWALPRTSHWTATAIENAGFEIRDCVSHIFGSGFPKSRNISKDFDTEVPAARYRKAKSKRKMKHVEKDFLSDWHVRLGLRDKQSRMAAKRGELEVPDDDAVSENAKKWYGWGTALKPASEHWILARKPLNGKIIKNILKYGVGGINIDGSRVNNGEMKQATAGRRTSKDGKGWGVDQGGSSYEKGTGAKFTNEGRWPANMILSHSVGCRLTGRELTVKSNTVSDYGRPHKNEVYGKYNKVVAGGYGEETLDEWECSDNCPVRELDAHGKAYGVHSAGKARGGGSKQDGDGALFGIGKVSRFFTNFTPEYNFPFLYVAKASTSEKEAGCEDLPQGNWNDGRKVESDRPYLRKETARNNVHPTVKSISLMRWLCRLVTPPKGIVLDPFMGSGTTGCATPFEGFRFIGIEKKKKFFKIAKARIKYWSKESKRPPARTSTRTLKVSDEVMDEMPTLFDIEPRRKRKK